MSKPVTAFACVALLGALFFPAPITALQVRDTSTSAGAPAASDTGQAADTARTAVGDNTDDSFPGETLYRALLLVWLFGAIGALAADLLGDGGKLEKFRKTDDGLGWILGYPGNLIVGGVSALIAAAANPPDNSWARLIGAALSAGVGGEALLLAIVKGKQAEKAKKEEEIARAEAEHAKSALRVKVETLNNIAGLGTIPVAEAAPMAAGADAQRMSVAFLAAAWKAEQEAADLVDNLTAKLRSLIRKIVGQDPGSRKLKDVGGNDANILLMIARAIAQTWPNLNPPFDDGDVSGSDTVAALRDRVAERMV